MKLLIATIMTFVFLGCVQGTKSKEPPIAMMYDKVVSLDY